MLWPVRNQPYFGFAMARFAGAFILSITLISGAYGASLPDHTLVRSGQGVVTDITDGDTLSLDDGTIVRLVGIQAPKLPLGRAGFRKWPLADASKAALSRLAPRQQVTLYIGGNGVDRWGRALAHLELDDGTWVQGAMLRQGMARVYSFADNRNLVGAMLALERAARSEGLGIWAHPFYAIRNPENVGRNINSFQLVEGRVVAAANVRGRVYLNFGTDWKTDFTILAPSPVRRMFEKKGVDITSLDGVVVRVRGWIKSWNGPMIELTHPEQLEILTRN